MAEESFLSQDSGGQPLIHSKTLLSRERERERERERTLPDTSRLFENGIFSSM
jgi:hypothetical protein